MKDTAEINENIAEEKIKECKLDEAEELLLQNVKNKTSSNRSYQLLIKLYKIKNDYNNIIKTINKAIRYCPDYQKEFKEIKKVIVLNKLLKDIFKH